MSKDDGAAQAAKFLVASGLDLGEVVKECRRLDAERLDAERLDAERQERKATKESQWLISTETMAILRVSRSTLWRLVRSGQLKAAKLSAARSGKLLISKPSLDALLESRRIVGRNEE